MKSKLSGHFPCGTKTENQQTKLMNDKFDELTKGMAQSVTRRDALKKFGVGLAGVALACFGPVNKAEAKHKPPGGGNECNHCRYPYGCETLPPDQQAGCLYYCNYICGAP